MTRIRRVSFVCVSLLLSCGVEDESGKVTDERTKPDVSAPEALFDRTYGPDDGVQARSDKLDLLFVIDNSRSMADKQAVLRLSIPNLVGELINPPCVAAQGAATTVTSPDAECPEGSARRRHPVRDLHVGVITSSLGSAGGEACEDGADMNDAAHLVPTLDRGRALPSYRQLGFAKYAPGDPEALANPTDLAEQLAQTITAAGEMGCGFEAPLEAAVRFLVDPAPPQDVVVERGEATPTGVDQVVLDQRAAFLRPDSAVQVIVVSDENDCSIKQHGYGWTLGTFEIGSNMPPSTSACESDPNDVCCRSCVMPVPDGCLPNAADASCSRAAYTPQEDAFNLRCFDQKRRFGIDLLYPPERYAVAFSEPEICLDAPNDDLDCECRASSAEACAGATPVANPLLAGGRHPSLVSVAFVTGVPWQNLATDVSDSSNGFVNAAALQQRWPEILGDLRAHVPPRDPFMRESVQPRVGTSPYTGEATTPPDSGERNALNGHEKTASDELQYACVFPLIEPRDCASGDPLRACDCALGPDPVTNDPLCQDPSSGQYGTTQYYAKAFPALRELEVARLLGARAQVASICSANLHDPSAADYAHDPAMQLVLDHLDTVLR